MARDKMARTFAVQSFIALTCLLALSLAGCSDGNQGAGAGGSDTKGQLSDIEGNSIIFNPSDTSGVSDSTISFGDTAETNSDGTAVDVSPDVPTVDPSCETSGGFNCPCTKNDDCDTGYCVLGPKGSICTKTCLDDCPGGFKCTQTGEGTDLTYLCSPTTTTLCQPCKKDADCDHPGAKAGTTSCLPRLDAQGSTVGSFCGSPCGDGVKCPSGFACQVLNLDGGKTEQCVPTKATTCACNLWGSTKKSETTCSVYNDKGTCWGTRSCGASGLSTCSAATPATESCNLSDDDCDGETDEGITFDDGGVLKPVGKPCGTGACSGGQVVCKTDGSEAICDSWAKTKAETCNFADDDCDGQTDEGMDVNDSDCLVAGICSVTTVKGTCTKGQWSCDYSAVAGYQAATETSCDGKDNNCDGQTDEGFVYGATKVSIGAPCQGIGQCGKGVVVCGSGQTAATCSTNADGSASEAKIEICDGLDNDCDGKTDEGCDDDNDGYCDANMTLFGKSPACLKGGGDCDDQLSTIHPDGQEICNDKDDDCNKTTDDGCDDDGDGYCDKGMVVVGKPKICSKGSGDCDDSKKAVNPGANEVCDSQGVDENCNGLKQEEDADNCSKYYFDEDGDGFGKVGSKARCLCKADTKSKHTSALATDCDDKKSTVNTNAKESCATTYDDNCNDDNNDVGAVKCINYYTDSDSDGFGDKKKPPVCLCAPIPAKQLIVTKGGDCNDLNGGVNPSKQESCLTSWDDNCNDSNNDSGALACTNFYKDSDGDGFGAKGSTPLCLCVANKPLKFTALKDGDCDDTTGTVKPGVKDQCSSQGIDDNCDGSTDLEDSVGCSMYYYDGDGDGAGIGAPRCLCSASAATKFTAKKSGDCHDSNSTIKPGAVELCNGADDNCNKTKDEGATAQCQSAKNATVQCVSASCSIAKCASKYFDVDKKYSTGCECKADGQYGIKGNSCTNAIIGATLVDTKKQRVTYTGNLMPNEGSQWYRVSTLDAANVNACDNYDVRIRFLSNPGGVFQMDVYRGSCSASAQLCKDEVEHRYRVDFYGTTGGPGSKTGVAKGDKYKSPNPNRGGECKCSTKTGKSGPSLPGYNQCTSQSALYYVRIHYKAGAAPVCSNFTVEFSNGYY
ncbi:MAG: putative metal-binding motif-containing protein [Myxococcales bacterium]|nr:putative metal-binding motif-containing protein [Myxococcales bacterium]